MNSLRERCIAILPGQYFDAETGLHQNWNRDYDPSIGRYLQADPLGLEGDISLYTYVANNPLAYTDPKGLYKYADPTIPLVTDPDLDAFLLCMDRCAGKEQVLTSTTDGKHADPGHAGGTSVDVRPTGTPSRKIFCCAGYCGAAYVLDERTRKTKYQTGPHYHIQLRPPSNPKHNAIPSNCPTPECK